MTTYTSIHCIVSTGMWGRIEEVEVRKRTRAKEIVGVRHCSTVVPVSETVSAGKI